MTLDAHNYAPIRIFFIILCMIFVFDRRISVLQLDISFIMFDNYFHISLGQIHLLLVDRPFVIYKKFLLFIKSCWNLGKLLTVAHGFQQFHQVSSKSDVKQKRFISNTFNRWSVCLWPGGFGLRPNSPAPNGRAVR